MPRNKTRRNRNKSEGGGSCGGNKMVYGGKRRSKSHSKRQTKKKMSKGAMAWKDAVMKVYQEMKGKGASFSDALREASKRKKAGTLY